MSRPMKLWIGNYDGRREGLIYATTKTAAARVAGCSPARFRDYWSEATRVVEHAGGAQDFEPETLYTRPISKYPKGVFVKGRCPL